MSVIDRVESAKHILAGSPIGRAIAKATSREIIGPKKKHVDYLLQVINFENVNIPNMVDMLFERTQNSGWIVTFKGLIVFHHLMSSGNERFIQCLASRSSTWMLQTFLDKSGVQGYDMSHAIRRYSHYLSEKAFIYRTIGYDLCRVPRGKENGVVRNMEVSKLLKALPEIQRQLDALLSTEFTGNDMTNGVITAAFMLLFKDLIRLFAGYNDGIINLLEQYFDMKKQDCKVSLDVYKKFVNRMERVSAFLRVAEDVGIEKGDIPDLTQAPSSLLTALENHYQSLEKGKTFTPPSKLTSLPSFNVSANAEKSVNPFGKDTFDGGDGDNDDAFEQERKALEEFQRKKKVQNPHQPIPTLNQTPPPAIVPPTSQPRNNRHPAAPVQRELLLSQAAQVSPPTSSAADDLLQLGSNVFGDSFQSNMTRSSTYPLHDQRQGDSWSSPNESWGQQQAATGNNPFNMTNNNTAFAPAFNSNASQNGDTLLGDLLTPEPASGPQPMYQQAQPLSDSDTKDLSSSLARAAKSLDDLSFNQNMQRVQTQKGKHQWKPQQPQVRTGGANYQGVSVAKNTLPAASQQGWPQANPPVGMQSFPGQAPIGMYTQYSQQTGIAPSGVGMYPVQPAIQRMNAPFSSQDPFGPVPGSQVHF